MTPPLDRRDFLKLVAAAGACAVAGSGRLRAEDGPALAPGSEAPKLPTRPFGKSGVQVSCLALGGMFDIPNNQLLLRLALQRGLTYWDTADCYEGGRSETGIGRFLGAHSEARKDLFLVSKSDARDPGGMSRLLDRSLERMQTDYVDLYFLHGVGSPTELNEETRAWAEQRKKDGKIRLFGFSTHRSMERNLAAADTLGWVDGIMFTYNYRLMHDDEMKAAVDACAAAGIGLTAMKTQGGGPVRTDSEAELELGGHFLKKGLTDAQAKIKAVWANPQIASICSQMPNLRILRANIAAATDSVPLAADDLEALNRYAQRTCAGYCAGCAHHCSDASGLPISDVMRSLMYERSYGDQRLAAGVFRALPPPARDALATADFGPAERACPRQLPIARLVKDAIARLA